MLPTRIFRSRWATLLWAAGILWTAYDVASGYDGSRGRSAPAGRDAMGEPINAADLAALANVAS